MILLRLKDELGYHRKYFKNDFCKFRPLLGFIPWFYTDREAKGKFIERLIAVAQKKWDRNLYQEVAVIEEVVYGRMPDTITIWKNGQRLVP